jgi:hypothetical protein
VDATKRAVSHPATHTTAHTSETILSRSASLTQLSSAMARMQLDAVRHSEVNRRFPDPQRCAASAAVTGSELGHDDARGRARHLAENRGDHGVS